jgi:hypothetical protein
MKRALTVLLALIVATMSGVTIAAATGVGESHGDDAAHEQYDGHDSCDFASQNVHGKQLGLKYYTNGGDSQQGEDCPPPCDDKLKLSTKSNGGGSQGDTCKPPAKLKCNSGNGNGSDAISWDPNSHCYGGDPGNSYNAGNKGGDEIPTSGGVPNPGGNNVP